MCGTGERVGCQYNSFRRYQQPILAHVVNIRQEVLLLLDATLGLRGRAAQMPDDAPLLGALPELDSMAVVAILTGIEDRFGVEIADDEVDGASFATVGALVEFVQRKIA